MAQSKRDESWRVTFRDLVSPAEAIIEEARNGRMFILVDDEDRENEGDLVIPAQMATPDAINFMARFGRGLICLAMTRQRVEYLKLPLMSRLNESRHTTAFTVSVEAREGLTKVTSTPYRLGLVFITLAPIPLAFTQAPLLVIVSYTVVGSLFVPFLAATLLYLNNKVAWEDREVPRNSMTTNILLVVILVLFMAVGGQEAWGALQRVLQ